MTPEERANKVRDALDGSYCHGDGPPGSECVGGCVCEAVALLPPGSIILTPDEPSPDMIARWIEAGCPPWTCDACRGGEYGPDGRPCVACGGHSEIADPPVISRIRAALDGRRGCRYHARFNNCCPECLGGDA